MNDNDKKAAELTRRQEIGGKLRSIMGHPDWPLMRRMMEDEIHLHHAKAEDTSYRQDPAKYSNIVRALDSADALQAFLDKIDSLVALGDAARKKIDEARESSSENS